MSTENKRKRSSQAVAHIYQSTMKWSGFTKEVHLIFEGLDIFIILTSIFQFMFNYLFYII